MAEMAVASVGVVTSPPKVSTGVDGGRRRNINLDALRGLAILLVLGHHVPHFAIWGRMGWAGVDLFFVLSGFLVSGLLFTEAKRNGGRIDIRRFYIRRAFKILPPLYFFVAVMTVPILFNSRGHSKPVLETIGVTLSFTSNYFPSYCMGIFGHLWSLAVEEHFYLVLPVLLLGFLRFGDGRLDPFRLIAVLFHSLQSLNS